MDMKTTFIIASLVWGVFCLIHAVLCRYAPAIAFGKDKWYNVKKEDEKNYIKCEVQTHIAISSYFFFICLVLVLDISKEYALVTGIILFILLWRYIDKKKKMLKRGNENK